MLSDSISPWRVTHDKRSPAMAVNGVFHEGRLATRRRRKLNTAARPRRLGTAIRVASSHTGRAQSTSTRRERVRPVFYLGHPQPVAAVVLDRRDPPAVRRQGDEFTRPPPLADPAFAAVPITIATKRVFPLRLASEK